MKRGQVSLVMSIILILIVAAILFLVVNQFLSASQSEIDDNVCGFALAGLTTIEQSTFGFSKEVQEYTDTILDLKNKIKTHCNTKISKISGEIKKQDLYAQLDKKFERCTKMYYNEDNPYYETSKKLSTIPNPNFDTMFCVVCEDIEIDSDLTFNQLDYQKHLQDKQMPYDYIGKFLGSQIGANNQDEIRDYLELFIDHYSSLINRFSPFQGVDNFISTVDTGTNLLGYDDLILTNSQAADIASIDTVNTFTKLQLEFFNPLWVEQSFRLIGDKKQESISLVLLHYDFNGPRSEQKPIMAVVPTKLTHYTKLADSSDYLFGITSYILAKLGDNTKSPDDTNILPESIQAKLPDWFPDLTSVSYEEVSRNIDDFFLEASTVRSAYWFGSESLDNQAFCTRFNYVTES